jgi:YQGE family putative transporter
LGTILQGLAAFLTIFLPSANLNRIFVYGLMFGLGGGIYWANKNYLSLKITRGKNRNYYNNLEGSLDLIIGTIMPVLIGWFIVLGSYLDIYSIESAYKLLMLIAFGLLVISGHLMQSANIQHETIQNISLPKSTRIWNLSRLVQIIYWTLGGINFIIPTVLVLMFVGEEGILGTVESVVYLFSAVILYYLGRKTDSRHHITIVMVCAAIFLLAAILYNFTFGLVGALIYTMFCSLTSGPAWNAIYTTTMEVMDKEHGENPSVSQYGYVLDNEIFFNLGRLLGMVLFFGLAYITTQETSLRFTPIIAGSLQLLLIYPLSILVRYHRGK